MEKELDIDYELKILGAMKSRIKGNPFCHRSGCHGKGTLGIKMEIVDGVHKPLLQTCECAQLGETEYKRLYDEISNGFQLLNQEMRTAEMSMRNFFLALDVTLVEMERRRLLGFIRWKFGFARQAVRNIWYKFRQLTAGKSAQKMADKQTTERPAGEL